VRGCSLEEKGGGAAVWKSSSSSNDGGAQERPRRGNRFFFSLSSDGLIQKEQPRRGKSISRTAGTAPSVGQ
jgi:hypothetical protein